jgi:hypothetical protein
MSKDIPYYVWHVLRVQLPSGNASASNLVQSLQNGRMACHTFGNVFGSQHQTPNNEPKAQANKRCS